MRSGVASGEGTLGQKSKRWSLKSKTCLTLLALALMRVEVSSGAETPAKHSRTAPHAAKTGAAKSGVAKAGAARASERLRAKAGHAKGKAASHAMKGKAARKTEFSAAAARLNRAFVASATLRPMAQQLVSLRSPAGYSAVGSYAASHPGAGAAAAYLAMGHAYALDRRYNEAADEFLRAGRADDILGDYADYLGAQALVGEQRYGDAIPLLDRFGDRHPESIFKATAPLLLANTYLAAKNGPAAILALEPLLGTAVADRADFKLTLGKAYLASGDAGKAAALFRSIYVGQPLSAEAMEARTQLAALHAGPTVAERKVHADQLFNAKRYAEASAEYSSIRNDHPSMPVADRDALLLYNAVCDLRLKHLGRRDIDRLQAANEDTAALKLYLYAEVSRTEKNRAAHDAVIQEMLAKYPNSRWFEEALYSGGNMYLLTHDAAQAIYHYKLLVEHFPNSIYAPSAHWREAWMNYRLRNYAEAARLMDEQVTRYGAGIEASSALYWRGRIYEDEERDFAHAASYYRSVNASYTNFYYGILARKRLAVLGVQPDVPATPAVLAVRKVNIPDLSDAVPENDPHLIKAKLLANAALNEYIPQEIAASPGSSEWGALAQAQIYSSFGEYTRALQSMKRSGISFFALPTAEVPVAYWRLIFPQPYWSDLVADSEKNGLDPYLVASLIRQESEFNAGAVSPAHAMGLMQLLPSVGKENAKRDGMRGFSSGELLNPSVNLELGTRNLKQVLDRFGDQPEYALAAYNAGDVPVRQWMAAGDYKDIPEFVESIPYTETREYVQAIMRNRELYRTVYGAK